jgi:leader peptidase (prepilin peptidase)/N-methyltransferase
VDLLLNGSPEELIWLPPLLVAPFIGSFMGVLIRRLPEDRPVILSRSTCDHCGTRLGVRDLVPVVSYLSSRGRCRHCGEQVAPFHLAVELAALAIPISAWISGWDGDPWTICLLGWTLLTLAWIDIRALLLPDVLTLPLLVAGLFVTEFRDPASLTGNIAAAVLGYLGPVAIIHAYRRLRGREGLGMGDAKLLAAIGAWLGLGLLPFTLLLAACLGLLAVGGAILAGKRVSATTQIPFGACLALAAWLVCLYADTLDDWLLG